MATETVRNVSVHYREIGQGQGVVLLHCSGSSGGQWRCLMERLGDRYHLLAPDLHGCGHTGAWPCGRTDLIADEVAIVEAMFDRVTEPVHLVGHSYGGHIAARAALKHPGRVASLTLIEPALFYLLRAAGATEAYREICALAETVIRKVEAGAPERAAETFVDDWVRPGAFGDMPAKRRAAVIASMAKLVQEWPVSLANSHPNRVDYRELVPPTLLIRGAATTLAASRVMGILHRILPEAELVEIEGAAHMAPVSHPEPVHRAIEAHLLRYRGPREALATVMYNA